MSGNSLLMVALLCFWASGSYASEISGQINIQARMTRKVLAPAVYELRGNAVSNTVVPRSVGKVAVWLEARSPSAVLPVRSTMQQRGRHLEPDLLIVPVGSTVEFPNLDPVFHNIFSLSSARAFDLGYYSEGKSRSIVFPRAGVVQVYCHIHPEMYGVVVVTPSRWSAVPSSDGAFSWPDVPAGKYRLMVWQKSAGLVSKSVNVPESGTVRVRVDLPEESADR